MQHNRRSRRSPVFLTATIEVGGVPEPVKLRNLSEEGALIEGERLPPQGSVSCFERKDLRVNSRIVWVRGRFAGVTFDQKLKPEDVLRHVPKPRPTAKSDFRRPAVASRPLTPDERKMIEIWLSTSHVERPGD